MAILSQASDFKVRQCSPQLKNLMQRVLLQQDFVVLESFKGMGVKKCGGSKHGELPARAIDIEPYPTPDKEQARALVKTIEELADSMDLKVRVMSAKSFLHIEIL